MAEHHHPSMTLHGEDAEKVSKLFGKNDEIEMPMTMKRTGLAIREGEPMRLEMKAMHVGGHKMSGKDPYAMPSPVREATTKSRPAQRVASLKAGLKMAGGMMGMGS